MKKIILGSVAITFVLGAAVNAEIIHDNDVLIGPGKDITDRLCVGSDCVEGQAFGNENIRIVEETPSILFEDTDTDAADWTIDINRGGVDAFELIDLETATIPFEVEVGVPNSALYVAGPTGDIGFGTSLPQKELHVVDSSFPTLRLEQDNTIGLPQVWDIFASNTGIGFQDISNGNVLPFAVRPGAPTWSMLVDTDGDVGLGTNSPSASLHVIRSDGSANVLIEENSATKLNNRIVLTLKNKGAAQMALIDTNNGSDWRFQNFEDKFRVNKAGTGVTELSLDASGNLTILGTLTEGSDKNAKMAIEPVDHSEILDKVAALDVSAWTYKRDADTGIRHIGPMAQDFHALFGLGATETGISTLDTSGVALAAIKALQEQNAAQTRAYDKQSVLIEELLTLTEELAEKNADLSMRLEELEKSLD